jgi:hypothetical protein
MTGEVSDQVVVKRPHPEADSDLTMFCTVVTDALNP